jgi:hypothetical protein
MNAHIPITQTPGQAIAITVALDHQPIIGPAPHTLGYIVNMALHKIRNAVVNALTVIGWIMWAVVILAVASPTLEGHIEDFVMSLIYTLI